MSKPAYIIRMQFIIKQDGEEVVNNSHSAGFDGHDYASLLFGELTEALHDREDYVPRNSKEDSHASKHG